MNYHKDNVFGLVPRETENEINMQEVYWESGISGRERSRTGHLRSWIEM